MQGCVHIVDDDASFRNAMERRLKHAGYEVATYPSALHLLVSLPNESQSELHSPRRADTGNERSGVAGAPERTRFDAAYHIPHWLLDIPATVRAIKAGADDFLTKPVASDDLFRAIERAIAHHRT